MKNKAAFVDAASLRNNMGQKTKQPWCTLLKFRVNADKRLLKEGTRCADGVNMLGIQWQRHHSQRNQAVAIRFRPIIRVKIC